MQRQEGQRHACMRGAGAAHRDARHGHFVCAHRILLRLCFAAAPAPRAAAASTAATLAGTCTPGLLRRALRTENPPCVSRGRMHASCKRQSCTHCAGRRSLTMDAAGCQPSMSCGVGAGCSCTSMAAAAAEVAQGQALASLLCSSHRSTALSAAAHWLWPITTTSRAPPSSMSCPTEAATPGVTTLPGVLRSTCTRLQCQKTTWFTIHALFGRLGHMPVAQHGEELYGCISTQHEQAGTGHLSTATSPAAAPKLSGKGMSQSVHEMTTARGAASGAALSPEDVLLMLVLANFACAAPLPCTTAANCYLPAQWPELPLRTGHQGICVSPQQRR